MYTGLNNRVIKYIEKPTYNYFDGMGIYVYQPEVLKYIKPYEYTDFPMLVNRLLENKEKVLAYHHDKSHYWIDMGNHGDYKKANEAFAKRKWEFLPSNQYK